MNYVLTSFTVIILFNMYNLYTEIYCIYSKSLTNNYMLYYYID